MKNRILQAKELLTKYKQEHIIQLLDKTEGKKREEIIDNILSIDFDELKELSIKAKETLDVDTYALEPVTALNPDRLPKEMVESYIETGKKIVCNNKFAVITMAGGQGSRLRNYFS